MCVCVCVCLLGAEYVFMFLTLSGTVDLNILLRMAKWKAPWGYAELL